MSAVCDECNASYLLVFLVVEDSALDEHVADVDVEPLGDGVEEVLAVDDLLVRLLGRLKLLRFLQQNGFVQFHLDERNTNHFSTQILLYKEAPNEAH